MRPPPVHKTVLLAAALIPPWFSGLAPAGAASFPVPSQAQVESIAALLPPAPQGVGRPLDDRPAWAQAARQPAFQDQMKQAAAFLAQPVPPLPDSLYDDYPKSGLREPYEKPYQARTTRLVAFAVAECIEDQGRFLPAIESEINAICDERFWSVPAHRSATRKLLDGSEANIDLGTAARAWTLATADYWLGGKLRSETRARLRREIGRRVFVPYEEGIRSGKPYFGWITGTNNWNAVCTSGVVGAALTLLPGAQERAFYVQSAQNSMEYYLAGFDPEGYAHEGLGYWTYGFGSYLCLAETLYEATQSRVNLFAGAKVRQIALFPRHFEIVDGVFPAFGDSDSAKIHGLGHAVDTALLLFINERWGMGWTDLGSLKNDMFASHPLGDRLYAFGLFGFPRPAYGNTLVAGSPAAPDETAQGGLRYFFKQASVFISRSQRPGAAHLGLALKGGVNLSGHGHNDNGVYVAVCNGQALVADAGREPYTAKSFGPHRYESMFMNSYGHDVPYVGGTLQKLGPDATGKIVRTDFTDDRDTLVMDLTASYPVAALKTLTRTYVLDRTRPAIEITDEAAFSEPTSFGGALVTLWDWRAEGPGVFLLSHENAAARATVTVDEGKLVNQPEAITGFLPPSRTPPERLGINVADPVLHVVMHTLIVPAEAPSRPPE